MKTLADVRRRTKPGTRFEVTGHTRRPELTGTVRTVKRTRATRYDVTLSTDDGTDAQGREYPIYWPAAADVRVTGPDTWEYDLASGGTVTLRFLPGPTD